MDSTQVPSPAPKAKRRPPAAGIGRKKGVPNKVTRDLRLVLKAAIEGTADKAAQKLDDLLDADPVQGLKCWTALAEFVMPKLGRTEHVGEGGGPLEFVIRDLAAE